jgi:SAM-dependent methyltransferase
VRYSSGAQTVEAALCCGVSHDPRYLEAIPDEVIQRDYGCGDPTLYVRAGETVLDLGSGSGKVCFIASQIVGPTGQVIGVDCNREMLALARKHQPEVAHRLGFDNVAFRCGLIQDLLLDLDLLGQELARHPIRDQWDWLRARAIEDQLRQERPLIADGSIDCVISSCVLNLVRLEDRRLLFTELFRVLKQGGRAAISDIVADRDVPLHLRSDPELWSGCVSGAFREGAFLRAFEEVGFHGIRIVARGDEPWRVVQGISFRSMTLLAYKDGAPPSSEVAHDLIYRGPFSQVEELGQVFPRGERVAVSETVYRLLLREPYSGMFVPADSQQGGWSATAAPHSSCCGTNGN